MKITTDTPHLMIIDAFPRRVVWTQAVFFLVLGVPGFLLVAAGAFSAGMFFFAVAVGFPMIFGLWVWERSQLVPNRSDNSAEIRRRPLNVLHVRHHRLSAITARANIWLSEDRA